MRKTPCLVGVIEAGQEEYHQQQRNERRKDYENEGFEHELKEEHADEFPKCFSQADFAGTTSRSGCGQIDIVDTGDQQNQNAMVMKTYM